MKHYSLTVAQGQEGADLDFSKKGDINDRDSLEQVAWRGYKSPEDEQSRPLRISLVNVNLPWGRL